ncbi:MAG TPA: hypothetical protein V6D33_02530 [Cyanophyceae cyanobacterium]
MNTQSLKKFLSLAGVATASVALSFPALAITHSNTMNSNQLSNPHVLAQGSNDGMNPSNDPSGNDMSNPGNVPNTDRTSSPEQAPMMNNSDGNSDRMSAPTSGSTTGGINNAEPSSTRRNLYGTSNMNNMNNDNGKIRHLITGGDSVTGTIFRCVNNPNPNCG